MKKEHYTEKQLLAFELQDQETELKCAIRDNLPESYIKQVEQKIISLKSLFQF
jgi:hypothetical protein